MADQAYTTQGFVSLSGVTTTGGGDATPGSTITWTSIVGNDTDQPLTDVDDDGVLIDGVDYFLGTNLLFTGYTITGTDSNEYGIFSDGGTYLVPLPVDFAGQTLILSSGNSNAYQSPESDAFLCFLGGTMIATPDGERLVETLEIGDMVRTCDGRDVAVKWLGRQTLRKLFAGPKMQPVRIRAGALGNALPHRDLTVTADHGMILSPSSSDAVGANHDNLVINASALVNGTTIDYVPLADLPDTFTVYHVETETHDVILANGAPSETFLDIPGRQAFDNYDEYLDLYGAERIIPEMNRSRIASQRLLPDQIKTRLGITEPLPYSTMKLTA